MKYRKKPVTIDAVQFDGTVSSAVEVFDAFDISGGKFLPDNDLRTGRILIPTLEGEVTASRGDWIIKGIAGEFYPCKPGIFANSYEACAMTTEPQAQTSERNPFFWIDAIRTATHTTDCNEKRRMLSNAADELEASIRDLQAKLAAREAELDFAQWSEEQVDAARGLLIYYLGGTQSKWSLRDHMRAGGYAIPLNEGENYNSLPKNLVVQLILRIAAAHAPRSEAGEDVK